MPVGDVWIIAYVGNDYNKQGAALPTDTSLDDASSAIHWAPDSLLGILLYYYPSVI